MQKLVWQNANGDSIDLTSGNYGITQWEGFSNTSLNIQSQQVPFQDGAVFLDALLNQRELSVTLKMQDKGNLEERYRMRRELIHALNPKLGEGYLIYTNDFISKRIKCVAQVPLFETHNSDTRGTPKASLSWIATNPYWEDLEETVVEIKDNNVKVIEYDGDVSSQLSINIFGNTQNPTIKNQTTKKSITINGDYQNPIQISTKIGNKYVYDAELDFSWLSGGSFICCYKNAYRTILGGNILLVINENGEIIKPVLPESMLSKQFTCITEIGNGKYLASTYIDVIISDDGIEWEYLRQANANCILYNNGLCILLGNPNWIYTSTDNGLTWQSHSTGHTSQDYTINGGCYCNGFYLTVGNAGHMMKSTDGLDWDDFETPTGRRLLSIAYGNGKIVITGESGYVAVSSDDGETWEQKTIGTTSDLTKVYFDKLTNSFFICAGQFLSNSEDGNVWNRIDVQGLVYAICGYKNSYIAVGTSTILTSSDSTHWDILSLSSALYIDIINVNNKLYALTDNYKISTSNDGRVWESKNLLFNGNRIIHINDYFYIITNHQVFRSADGITNYNMVFNNNSIWLSAITNGKGLIIAVGAGGSAIISSDDGETWNILDIGGSQLVCTDIVFADNKFYIFCLNGEILRSYDGYTWVNIANGRIGRVTKICYGNGIFVGYGTDTSSRTVLLKSKDCLFWETQLYSGLANSVNYINNQFFVGLDNGTVLGTYNGIDWIIYELDKGSLLTTKGVLFLNGEYIAYGNILFYSDLELLNNLIDKLSVDSDLSLGLNIGNNTLVFNSNSQNGDSGYAEVSYRQKYLGV